MTKFVLGGINTTIKIENRFFFNFKILGKFNKILERSCISFRIHISTGTFFLLFYAYEMKKIFYYHRVNRLASRLF